MEVLVFKSSFSMAADEIPAKRVIKTWPSLEAVPINSSCTGLYL